MTATSVGEIYFLMGSFLNYVDVVGCEMVLKLSMVSRFALRNYVAKFLTFFDQGYLGRWSKVDKIWST
jgi:hypothetical protein